MGRGGVGDASVRWKGANHWCGTGGRSDPKHPRRPGAVPLRVLSAVSGLARAAEAHPRRVPAMTGVCLGWRLPVRPPPGGAGGAFTAGRMRHPAGSCTECLSGFRALPAASNPHQMHNEGKLAVHVAAAHCSPFHPRTALRWPAPPPSRTAHRSLLAPGQRWSCSPTRRTGAPIERLSQAVRSAWCIGHRRDHVWHLRLRGVRPAQANRRRAEHPLRWPAAPRGAGSC